MSDKLFGYEPEALDPRKGKKNAPGAVHSSIGSKDTITRTVRRTPEVMIKISSSAKNMRKVRENLDYISRKGMVEVEDERGHTFIGLDVKEDALYSWRKKIPEAGARRRETFNVIFSMPAGTPREEVSEAVRQFAADKYKNHQYLFATHTDEDHPHVHVIVKSAPINGGKRLNPRKADLQKWRELFADKLRTQGIEANATPRYSRGVTRKAKKQAVLHIDKRSREHDDVEPSRVTQAQEQAAIDEVGGRASAVPSPFMDKLRSRRQSVLKEYGEAARGWLKGNQQDRILAVEVTKFAQKMPPVETQHSKLVSELRQRSVADKVPQKGPER